MKKLLSLLVMMLAAMSGYSQAEAPQMADGLRSDGKIYVVVAVLSIVFLCLVTYLVIIDRKVKKLEDK